jgi:hypothetical protein
LFFISQVTGRSSGRTRKLNSIIGKLPISEKQAHRLEIKPYQRISPYLTECCLPLKKKAAQNFCTYLQNHRHRIINYDYFQAENICSIASGAVESTVKQIDRRLKIAGAQWKSKNVSQVLKHRCVTRS